MAEGRDSRCPDSWKGMRWSLGSTGIIGSGVCYGQGRRVSGKSGAAPVAEPVDSRINGVAGGAPETGEQLSTATAEDRMVEVSETAGLAEKHVWDNESCRAVAESV